MSKTRDEIKAIAVRMVKENGLINLSRSGLCAAAGIPDGSFPYVMGCNFSEFVGELRVMGLNSPLRKVSKTRTNPELRKEHILDTAVAVAKSIGYNKITRDQVAEAAGVSPGLISRYFPAMVQLRKAVMRQAVRHEIPEIIAQGLAADDDRAKGAPPELKSRACALLLNA